jgi:hypothetical protein
MPASPRKRALPGAARARTERAGNASRPCSPLRTQTRAAESAATASSARESVGADLATARAEAEVARREAEAAKKDAEAEKSK